MVVNSLNICFSLRWFISPMRRNTDSLALNVESGSLSTPIWKRTWKLTIRTNNNTNEKEMMNMENADDSKCLWWGRRGNTWNKSRGNSRNVKLKERTNIGELKPTEVTTHQQWRKMRFDFLSLSSALKSDSAKSKMATDWCLQFLARKDTTRPGFARKTNLWRSQSKSISMTGWLLGQFATKIIFISEQQWMELRMFD